MYGSICKNGLSITCAIVKPAEITMVVLYSIMTGINIAVTSLLFMLFHQTKCNMQTPKLLFFTYWAQIVLSSLLKLASIFFFRYDLVSNRFLYKTITLWRPYFICFLLIGIGPSLNLPLYTFNYEFCELRNYLFNYKFSTTFQIAATFTLIGFLLHLAILYTFLLKKPIKDTNDRSPFDLLSNLSLFTQFLGILLAVICTIVSIIALTVLNRREFYVVSIVELLQMGGLLVLLII